MQSGFVAPACGRHARTQVRVDPTGPTRGLLFAKHPGCGFCCLGIVDDRIQFDINQVAPIVHMLGEGGHIARFQDVPAQNRAGHVIPSNLFHSLGRRTAGFEKLLKRRLVETGARSLRQHEFHGALSLIPFEVWSGRRTIPRTVLASHGDRAPARSARCAIARSMPPNITTCTGSSAYQ